MSRTGNSLNNLAAALVGQALSIVISFGARIVFIRCLGNEYLCLNGLFTNILTVFSLVELGVGPAMNFSLYKPLANNDREKIKSLMALYRKAYVFIGCLIAVIGIAFTPFYTVFMDEVPDIPNLTLIYLLFTANTVISYFFSYKRALMICDDKRYISTIYRYAFYLALNIVQIIMLVMTKNYILFLCLQIIFTFGENFAVSRRAEKMYPYLKDKDVRPVDSEDAAEIKKNISAMLMHKIGGMAVMSTDNLILSKFVSLASVGIYSNYYLITDALVRIINQIFSSVISSVGNLNACSEDDNKEKLQLVFDRIFFLDFWIFGFCSCCLWTLFNPFIELWLGDESLIFDDFTVLMIVLNFYLTGMRKAGLVFREATGAFYYDRFKPIAESVINIAVSIILAGYFGAAGVFMGTVISTLTTCMWIEPYVLYKYVFRSGGLSYALRFIGYTAVSVGACIITSFISDIVVVEGLWGFLIKMAICAVLPNLIFLLIFFRSDHFRYFSELIVSIIKKLVGKVTGKNQ